jgi:hypothetical protein
MNRSLALLIACFVTASTLVRAEDWPAFRGAKGDGVSNEKHAPLHWGPDKNIKWKIELPGPGNSSPVVSGTRVFLTCAKEQGRDRGTYCYDRNSGQLLWSKHVVFEEKDPTHNTNPYCGSSAGADGKRVVVWHGSAGLYCYDYDGNELWKRDLGEFKHIWGYGQSPPTAKRSGRSTNRGDPPAKKETPTGSVPGAPPPLQRSTAAIRFSSAFLTT